MTSTSAPVSKPDKVKWTHTEETILVDTLLVQKELGLQSENGWKPSVWTTVVSALHENFRVDTPKQAKHCKSWWQRLRSQFRIVQTLCEQSGFGWSDALQMVTAPAHVWDAYISSHPKAQPFRTKAFPMFDKLSTIIDGTVATGSAAVYTNLELPVTQVTQSEIIEDINEEKDRDNALVKHSRKHKRSETSQSVTTAAHQPGKRQRNQVTGAEAMVTMSNAMASLALAIKAKSSTAKAAPPNPTLQREVAIQLLEKEAGLSDDDKADAALIFEDSEHAVDTFLAFHEDGVRLKRLQKKLAMAK
ncbi:hypothetical protein BOTBODRAFT_175327 [Botryobasidium botryosum FD-172 SS1]|uniref:Myb/SANT-like domain-containing protein n=1 Tax=Botryobasidium botryosum (strain FD-172 SS1) TaxID=930990 RepID=A0A067MCW0_BOTB1|nr:hypothetical protein BOTBODRAFT_175327 [Botryobasidium botryosum FD-172 SS1]